MNWELVKDLPDNMIAVYYLDGKSIHGPLIGKFRKLVRPVHFSYNDDYEFVRLTPDNKPMEVYKRDEVIFFAI